MGLFGSIAGAVGGIASTILGNNSAKNEAEKNRNWQEEMSNTSIQRRMKDLKEAGLNPLLAVNSASSGASTPSGAVADTDYSALGQLGQNFSSARLMSAQAKGQEVENKNKEEEIRTNINKIKADTKAQELDNIMESKRLKIFEENPSLMKDYVISQFVNNPYSALNTETGRSNIAKTFKSFGKGISNTITGTGKSLKDFSDNFKIKREYKPRIINESRISR